MSTYPRLTLESLRALVRELTGVLSADVITDERLTEWLNESLYNVNAVADNISQAWNVSGSPITVIESGTTYRFPGWEWDNTTQYPSGIKANLYMESNSDTPPWNDGFYDALLAYDVTSRVFKQIVDDTPRAVEYDAKYKELANTLLRDKFLAHNSRFINVNSATLGYMSLYLITLQLIDELVNIDSSMSVSLQVQRTVTNEVNELYGAFKWPFGNSFLNFAPYVDIFAYGAAARLAGEQNLVDTHLTGQVGLSDLRIQTLKQNYESRLSALKTTFLSPLYVSNRATTLATVTAQVRGLIQEYSKDLSDELIYSLADDAYMSLCYERNWSFLDRFAEIEVFPQQFQYPILGENYVTPVKRILNVYKIPEAGYLFGSSRDVDKLDRLPHALDTTNNDSKYRYDIRDILTNVTIDDVVYPMMVGNLLIAPTPEESFFLKVRYTSEPVSLLTGGTPLIDSQFIRYLVYATVLNVLAFTGYGDKKLTQNYNSKVEEIKAQMYRYYELDASTDSFQLGETGLSIPKYIPHFRVD